MLPVTAHTDDFVAAFEGFREVAYSDQGGRWTVGYGSTGPDIIKGVRFSREQARLRLHDDLVSVSRNISKYIKIDLNPHQSDAVLSLSYNIGARHFIESAVLRLINQYHLPEAADRFLKWDMVDGKVINGLVRRRRMERDLFLTPMGIER